MASLVIRVGEVHPDSFYSDKGWGNEPLTSTLNVPGEDIGAIFPASDPKISLTLAVNGEFIGHSSANNWSYFVKGVMDNTTKLLADKINPGTKIFALLLQQVVAFEIDYVNQNNLPVNTLAHTSGLMVLKDYNGKGYATELRNKHLIFLKEQGFTHVITETTNIGSASVMQKLGYTKLKSWPYPTLGITLNDEYAVWIKQL
jgi:GNAT superfamily N-acetyltransferase